MRVDVTLSQWAGEAVLPDFLRARRVSFGSRLRIQQCAHFRRSSSNLLAASSASRVDKGEIGAVALGPGRSEGREKRVIASAGAGPGW